MGDLHQGVKREATKTGTNARVSLVEATYLVCLECSVGSQLINDEISLNIEQVAKWVCGPKYRVVMV
jgi:hypothetical protein